MCTSHNTRIIMLEITKGTFTLVSHSENLNIFYLQIYFHTLSLFFQRVPLMQNMHYTMHFKLFFFNFAIHGVHLIERDIMQWPISIRVGEA